MSWKQRFIKYVTTPQPAGAYGGMRVCDAWIMAITLGIGVAIAYFLDHSNEAVYALIPATIAFILSLKFIPSYRDEGAE